MTRLVSALCLAGSLATMALSADAQSYRTNNPNLGHFYMGRQEIQIEDDAPVVNDRRTAPGAAQAGGAAGGGPKHAVPLPRAGWQPYSSSVQSMPNSLPKVFNGVPPKAPPPAPVAVKPQKAKAGAYKAATAKPASHPGPSVAKGYEPYKGYGGKQTMAAPSTPYGAAATTSSSTNVQGSLLHWSRSRRPPQ